MARCAYGTQRHRRSNRRSSDRDGEPRGGVMAGASHRTMEPVAAAVPAQGRRHGDRASHRSPRILAAARSPGTTGGASDSAGRSTSARDAGRTRSRCPLNGEPIATDTPIEAGATLQVYNWSRLHLQARSWRSSRRSSTSRSRWTTFNNMEEGIQKLVAGQVKPDVFFPTTDYVSPARPDRPAPAPATTSCSRT